jgi:hypothetical protein
VTTIIASAVPAEHLLAPLSGLGDEIDRQEREDNQRGPERDETDTAGLVDELLAALFPKLVPTAGPPCCGQAMVSIGPGCWRCEACGNTLTPLHAAHEQLLVRMGEPPLPTRPPNPGRHDQAPPRPEPGRPHPQLTQMTQCWSCKNWSSQSFCPDCGASKNELVLAA